MLVLNFTFQNIPLSCQWNIYYYKSKNKKVYSLVFLTSLPKSIKTISFLMLNRFKIKYTSNFTSVKTGMLSGLNEISKLAINLGNLKILIWRIQKAFIRLLIGAAQKMKFSINNFFSKCEQIHRKLRILPHLPKKFLMENFIFRVVLSSVMVEAKSLDF